MPSPPNSAFSAHDTGIAPVVSVIMCVYNGEAHVEEAIYSILKQTFADFELIVVDDASTDSTAAKLAAFTDPRLKVLRNEKNMERTYSRNLAVEHAQAPLIAIMDADDYSFPYRLERQVAFMQEHPEVGLCAGLMEGYANGDIQELPYGDAEIRLSLMSNSCLPHSTWMLRKSIFLVAGGYKHHPAEDYELLGRLSGDFKFKFACLPEALVRYRTHPESPRTNYKQKEKDNAGQVRVSLVLRLIPDASQEELACHQILCTVADAFGLTALAGCLAWVKRLTEANAHAKLYEHQSFCEFWRQRWLSVCEDALSPALVWQVFGGGLGKTAPSDIDARRAVRAVASYRLFKKLLPSRLRLTKKRLLQKIFGE